MPRTEYVDTPIHSAEDVDHRRAANEGPSPLLMCAYFLGLASIVVVVIGGQFPWFTLAPLAVLLMAVHVRRLEAKLQRDSACQVLNPHVH